MSETDEGRQERIAREAVRGDLRPQFNAFTPLHERPEDLRSVEAILLERLFHLSRPIANAAEAGGKEMRLSDAGHFFYLIETLRRAGSAHLESTLLVILDEFLQLTARSYNELYLWSIVELSRTDSRHVETFWPAVIALDERFRFAPWVRPTGTSVVDQPYRMCELLFYFYTIYTLDRAPSLGRCLLQIRPQLTREQKDLVGDTLQAVERAEWRASYGDAFGMLRYLPRKRKSRAE